MTKGQIRKMFLEGRKVKEGRTIQVVGAVKPKSRARLTSSSRPPQHTEQEAFNLFWRYAQCLRDERAAADLYRLANAGHNRVAATVNALIEERRLPIQKIAPKTKPLHWYDKTRKDTMNKLFARNIRSIEGFREAIAEELGMLPADIKPYQIGVSAYGDINGKTEIGERSIDQEACNRKYFFILLSDATDEQLAAIIWEQQKVHATLPENNPFELCKMAKDLLATMLVNRLMPTSLDVRTHLKKTLDDRETITWLNSECNDGQLKQMMLDHHVLATEKK